LPKKRTPIPQKTLDRLLVKCKHSCVICGREWVKIHHIDGKRSNNHENNLVPLCGHHAGMVHISPPPSAGVRRITKSQLRLYKKDWIEKCSSISPTVFTDIRKLKLSQSELEGRVEKLEQPEGRK
jgi:hypothetical protein